MTFILAQTNGMTVWGVWIAFGVVGAILVFATFLLCNRRNLTPAALGRTWTGLLFITFFSALGIAEWLESTFLAPLIAFFIISMAILDSAIASAYGHGLKGTKAGSGNESGKVTDS